MPRVRLTTQRQAALSGSCSVPTQPRKLLSRLHLSPHRLLVLSALGFAALQLGLVGPWQPLEWDEAVYWSQVLPGPKPTYGATRAQGILWLAWPASLGSAHVPQLRLYLMGCSSLLFYLALRPWVRYLGQATVGSTVALLAIWPAVYYGGTLSPNLFAALSVLGTFGYGLQYAREGSLGSAVSAALLAFFAVLLRPPDSAVVFACYGAALLVTRQWRLAVALGLGALVAMLAWAVESHIRFSGIAERLSAASAHVTQARGTVPTHQAHLFAYETGRLIGRVKSSEPATHGLLTWAGLLASGAAAVFAAHRRGQRELRLVLATSVLGSLSLALFYFLKVTLVAPRFLLPSYLMLLPHVGFALHCTGRRPKAGWARIGAGIVLAAFLVPWSFSMVASVEAKAATKLRPPEAVGRHVTSLVKAGEPCLVSATFGKPQFMFYSGCDYAKHDASGRLILRGSKPDLSRLGTRVFVATKSSRVRRALRRWHPRPVPGLEGWTLLSPRAPQDIRLKK